MFNSKALFPDGIPADVAGRLEVDACRLGLLEADDVDEIMEVMHDDSREKEKERLRRVSENQDRIKQLMVEEARRSGVSEAIIRKAVPELALPRLTPQEAQRLQAIEERLHQIKPQIVEKCEAIGNLLIEFNNLHGEGRGIVSGKDHKGFGEGMDLQNLLGGVQTYFKFINNTFVGKPVPAFVNELRQTIGLKNTITESCKKG